MNTTKEKYVSPRVEAIGLLPEGVIAMSDPRFYDPYGGQKDL